MANFGYITTLLYITTTPLTEAVFEVLFIVCRKLAEFVFTLKYKKWDI